MDDITDFEITGAMIVYGGSFAAHLGDLFRSADAINQARIKDAFPDEWAKYRTVVILKRDRWAALKPEQEPEP